METTPISKMPQPQQGEDNNQFIISNDNEMMKQILATHADHSCHKVDVRHHIQLIEKILWHSTTLKRTNIHEPQVCLNMKSLDEKIQQVDFMGMLEALAYAIHKISNEGWGCALDNGGIIQVLIKILLGCQGGGGLCRFCCHLWGVLAGGRTLRDSSVGQVHCIVEAIT
ncbi:uncharacterized protein LOC122067667 [Macadamia integrifolia]|uniref:uncharacterized protein LOC122067667 n=1 Tax=Macadamia integrifolia TaxID=60698 RepID=UPI001C4F91CA|nr:uncharacterized protein LOC122067667 [Macadamia integrifolia]